MGCIDFIDEHYVPILGLQILQGRNVHQDGEVLVNEELLRQVGWTDSPIGRKLMEDNYEWGLWLGSQRLCSTKCVSATNLCGIGE